MIKINLAARRQPIQLERPKGEPIKIDLKNINLDAIKEHLQRLPIRKVLVPVIVSLIGYYAADSYKTDEMEKAQNTLVKVQEDGKRLQAEVDKGKELEAIKKSLEADETTIRTKLDTIKKLIQDRNTSVKLLLTLSNAIPKDVWLTEMKIENTDVSLKGGALDFTYISDFMKNLKESANFSDVDFKTTEREKSTDGKGENNAVFEFSAKWR